LDEVQCGVARTGTWFAFQHTGVLPDVMTLAKGLGSGVPIGACVARGPAAETFGYGNHGSTFGGNPLATAAALTTLEVIERDRLRENAEARGDWMAERFRQALAGVPGVLAVRNAGLMMGIQLDRPCAALVEQARQQRLLINVT